MSDNGPLHRPPDAAEAPGESIEKKVRTGAWVVSGLLLTWKLGRQLAGAALDWLSTDPGAAHAPRQRSAAQEQPTHERKEEQKESDRADDRNLTLAEEEKLFARRQWGTFFVVCAMAIAAAGGFGFLWTYWTGGANEWLGGDLAMFFFGLGSALVLWSQLLMVHKEAVDPREEMQPPPHLTGMVAADFDSGRRQLHRRGLLKGMVAGALGFFAVMVVSLLRSFGFDPAKALYSPVWRRGERLMTAEGKPVKVGDLELNSLVLVYPENSLGSEKAQTVLLRVDPALIQMPPERANWAPNGNLAYSRVCTHAGCSVGLFETTAHLLLCPCHQSTFDVLRCAQPTGGPAARPLPQLPIYADSNGVLRAGGGFSEPPGPGFWGMPLP